MSLPEQRTRSYYNRPADQVAQDLLGDWLLADDDAGWIGGPIIETEAYLSTDDDANHALQSGKTDRNEAMFGPPGTIYVYLIYGMYHCLNVVCREKEVPEAVLIRAIHPRKGVQRMIERRQEERSSDLPQDEIASGPGKLCMALNIDRSVDGGTVIGGDNVSVRKGVSISEDHMSSSSRIGVDYAETAGDWPLRYRVDDSYPID